MKSSYGHGQHVRQTNFGHCAMNAALSVCSPYQPFVLVSVVSGEWGIHGIHGPGRQTTLPLLPVYPLCLAVS